MEANSTIESCLLYSPSCSLWHFPRRGGRIMSTNLRLLQYCRTTIEVSSNASIIPLKGWCHNTRTFDRDVLWFVDIDTVCSRRESSKRVVEKVHSLGCDPWTWIKSIKRCVVHWLRFTGCWSLLMIVDFSLFSRTLFSGTRGIRSFSALQYVSHTSYFLMPDCMKIEDWHSFHFFEKRGVDLFATTRYYLYPFLPISYIYRIASNAAAAFCPEPSILHRPLRLPCIGSFHQSISSALHLPKIPQSANPNIIQLSSFSINVHQNEHE